MIRFIKELRRRSVFRVAGIYVGVAWLLIEIASVLLPTFGASDWVLRSMFVVAFIGFPIALVLGWAYELTKEGLIRDEEITEGSQRVFGGRSRDMIAIGVLSVALIVSLYFNTTLVQIKGDQYKPVSVLIADFENRTGNDLFDRSLEQALHVGVEGAPFITSHSRGSALTEAGELGLGENLTEKVSRLISRQLGVDLVIAGAIEPAGTGFELAVSALDPETGEKVTSASTRAKSSSEVMAAVGVLSGKIREALGDENVGRGPENAVEVFTAASLEAAREYARARESADAGEHEASLLSYARAIDQDPNFAPALSGWALELFNLGREAEATALWERALTQMHTMTERERFRAMGSYHYLVGDFELAKASLRSLVEKYPADASGHSSLAQVHFAMLDFESALVEGRRALEIYPMRMPFRSNYVRYAMYAGDFDIAEAEARKTLQKAPGRYEAWLPIAMAALNRRDYEAARDAYHRMAETGSVGTSVASLGLADIELYLGNFPQAVEILEAGIAKDQETGDQRSLASKLIVLAEAHAALDDTAAAKLSLEGALEITSGPAQEVPAARLYLELDETARATAIASLLRRRPQTRSRAYGLMTEAMIRNGETANIEAVNRLREALSLADLWLVHFELAQVYLHRGDYAEALDELTICEERRGEVTALFLDDLPSWRYLTTLPYWTGRAQEALGIEAAARSSFEQFLTLRPRGGPLAEDARKRLQ